MFLQNLFLIAGLLGPQVGHSQSLCAPNLGTAEFVFPSVQLQWGDYNPQDYKQGRPLRKSSDSNSYEGMSLAGFIGDLDHLTPADIWMDGGAGGLRAILDYFRAKGLSNAARVIAVVDKMSRRTTSLETLRSQVSSQKLYPIIGKKVEEINLIPAESLALISDIYGAGTYTWDLDAVLRRYLMWLKVGGHLYMTMGRRNYIYFWQDVPRRKYKLFGPKYDRKEWVRYFLWAYLEKIEGIKFETTPFEDRYMIHIQKLKSRIIMPTLNTERYRYDHPPMRGYIIP